MKTKFTILLIAFGAFYLQAQQPLAECANKTTQFDSLVKTNNFKEATQPWLDVREKCPAFSETIYTSGEKILHYAIDNATADEKELVVRDLLKLYDQYDSNFPKNTHGNSVNKAMTLHNTNLGSPAEIYGLLHQAFQNSPEDFTNPNALYLYFDLFFNKYKSGNQNLQAEDVFAQQDAIEYQLIRISKKASATDRKSYKRISDAMNKLTAEIATCEKLLSFYQKNFESKKNDGIWLEKASAKLASKVCFSDPLFLKIAQASHQFKPTSVSAYQMGTIAFRANNQEQAVAYFNQAAELNESNMEKAQIYYTAASTIFIDSNKALSKEYAYKAIKADPSFGKGYFFLAQLYVSGVDTCGQTPFEKKALYWLAAGMAVKAGIADVNLKPGADKLAATYLQKAPSAAEVKEAKKAGKTITFNCWINESVTVPK